MILDKETEKKYKKILRKYDKEYFDEHTKELIKMSLVLIDMLELGDFAWDTADVDFVLWSIREAINKIDI